MKSLYERLGIENPLADMVYVLYGDRPWRDLRPLQKVLVAFLLGGPPVLLLLGQWAWARTIPLRLMLFFWIVAASAAGAAWCAARLGLHRKLVSTLTMLLSVWLFGFPYFGAVAGEGSILPALIGLAASFAVSLGVGFVWKALGR